MARASWLPTWSAAIRSPKQTPHGVRDAAMGPTVGSPPLQADPSGTHRTTAVVGLKDARTVRAIAGARLGRQVALPIAALRIAGAWTGVANAAEARAGRLIAEARAAVLVGDAWRVDARDTRAGAGA